MATFEGYVVAAVGFGMWVLGYAVLQLVNSIALPLAVTLDTQQLLTAPIKWAFWLEQYWILIGLIGLFVFLLAKGAVTGARRV